MPVTDPIGDMLTKIRNANTAKLEKTDVSASRIKEKILEILKEEGYIKDFKKTEDEKQGVITIYLAYGPGKRSVFNGIKRLSTPGLRVYCSKRNIPKVFKRLGLTIVSTSKGIMSDKKAQKENVGGEALCYIW